MKQYFLYELKRQLLPLAVFVLFETLMSIVIRAYAFDSYEARWAYAYNIIVPIAILFVSSAALPVYVFSFALNRRGADFYYSFPLRREKLYCVRLLIGLVLMLVPFTVAYWGQVIYTAVLPDEMFVYMGEVFYGYYFPLYCSVAGYAILLFGLFSFVFLRGNTIGDGIAFLAIVLALPCLAAMALRQNMQAAWLDWSFFGPMTHCYNYWGELIREGAARYPYWATEFEFTGWQYLPVLTLSLYCALGAASYGGIVVGVRKKPSESVGQISDSWFGYRTLLPALIFLLGGIVTKTSIRYLFFLPVVIGYFGYVAYRRGFRLRWTDYVCFGTSVALGLLFGVFVFG